MFQACKVVCFEVTVKSTIIFKILMTDSRARTQKALLVLLSAVLIQFVIAVEWNITKAAHGMSL